MTTSKPKNNMSKKEKWERYLAHRKATTRHWREYAAQRQWRHISPFHVPIDECSELIAILEPLVTQRTWGEGVELHIEFIKSEEATTTEEADALNLLHSLLKKTKVQPRSLNKYSLFREIVGPPRNFRRARYKYPHKMHLSNNRVMEYTITREEIFEDHDNHDEPLTSPFTAAVELARQIIRQHGIELQGWRSTFVYPDPGTTGWVNISRKRARVITQRRAQLRGVKHTPRGDQEPRVNKEREEIDWLDRYPWRRCGTLGGYFKGGYIEPNSLLWHASNILEAHAQFRTSCGYETSVGRLSMSRREAASTLLSAVSLGQRIGSSFEALRMKPKLEPYAMKQLKRIQDNARGGREKGRIFESTRQELVSSIQKELVEGGTITDALRRVAAHNLDAKRFKLDSPSHEKEFSRIKRFWYRHSKK